MTADGRGVNCMVWYNLLHAGVGHTLNTKERRDADSSTIAACEGAQPRVSDASRSETVDLSALALCVHDKYTFEELQLKPIFGPPKKHIVNLRGVAVIPIFPLPRGVQDLEGYGLDTPEGHILLQVTNVASEDPEVPILGLQYVGFLDMLPM